MKKIIVFLIFIVAIGIIVYFFYPSVEEKTIEYTNNGEKIKILNEKNEIIFEYDIFEFQKWAKENWDNIFETRPAFGEVREVNPEYFYVFDNTAAISPSNNFLAFSVNDYAVATNISFVGKINIKTKEISLVKDKNIGGIRALIWSPKETHVAYILDTARSAGDYLSVDNILEMKKEFTLSDDDIIKALMEEEDANYQSEIYAELMPDFRNIKWIEKGEKLEFISSSYDKKAIRWNIDFNGKNLEKEGIFEK